MVDPQGCLYVKAPDGSLIPLRGPRGEKGDTGPAGPQGPPGDQATGGGQDNTARALALMAMCGHPSQDHLTGTPLTLREFKETGESYAYGEYVWTPGEGDFGLFQARDDIPAGTDENPLSHPQGNSKDPHWTRLGCCCDNVTINGLLSTVSGVQAPGMVLGIPAGFDPNNPSFGWISGLPPSTPTNDGSLLTVNAQGVAVWEHALVDDVAAAIHRTDSLQADVNSLKAGAAGTPIVNLGHRVTRPNTDDRLVEVWNGASWSVVGYDSGWRDVAGSLVNGWTGNARIRRIDFVTFWDLYLLNGEAATADVIINEPAGFGCGRPLLVFMGSGGGSNLFDVVVRAGALDSTKRSSANFATVSYPSKEPIPTSLPGTLITPAPA